MKNAIRLAAALVVMLVALTGCQLYNAINLIWSINALAQIGLSPDVRVTYTVQNLGKYDLNGVNLLMAVDRTGDGFYEAQAWTPDFNITQGQIITTTVDVYGVGTMALLPMAAVLSIDMDKPQ
jgi:hypothetical protein